MHARRSFRRARTLAGLSLLASGIALQVLSAVPASSQTRRDEPQVDIVEIPGTIDRPIARYLEERIRDSNRRGVDLLLFQADSAGLVKVTDAERVVPRLATQILESEVPVAMWAGPRDARIGHGVLFLLQAADIAAMTPSAQLGPLHPIDIAHPGRWSPEREREALAGVAERNRAGADVAALDRRLRASEASAAGLVDLVVPTAGELLRRIDGRTARTATGVVTLRLPADATTVTFHQPGPLRRGLHALANPGLAYVLLLSGGMLVAFELFQPGFGVAGVSAIMFLACAVFGLTVLPVRIWALALVAAGLALLTLDVAMHDLGIPTAAGTVVLGVGSLFMFPGAAGQLTIPSWLAAVGVASALVFFVPVMTVVRRGRRPVAERAGRHLIGEPGEVRSVLNPEGYVWVAEALWRARSEDGERIRVGEDVVVVAIEGAVLRVRRPA